VSVSEKKFEWKNLPVKKTTKTISVLPDYSHARIEQELAAAHPGNLAL
jgi:hypothetical protein